MNTTVEYLSNTTDAAAIAEHLSRCDADFVPPLSGRVQIAGYAAKLADKAIRFEAWSGDTLVGLVAAYCNDPHERMAYVTSVSVLKDWTGKGIAACLLGRCIAHAVTMGMRGVRLEVAADNTPAIALYRKHGFLADIARPPFIGMHLYFNESNHHEPAT